MALVPETTSNATGTTFSINFEDNGNPSGPRTPVSFVIGPALTALTDILQGIVDGPMLAQLEGIAAAVLATQTVQFASPQEVTGTLSSTITGNVSVIPGGTFPVSDGTAKFTWVQANGSSTGSAIAAVGANANRQAFYFQNCSDTDFTVNFFGTASASAGDLVAPGRTLEFYGAACPTGAISIFCGVASKRYQLRTA